MLTRVDGYSMEGNNYMHLETALFVTALFSSRHSIVNVTTVGKPTETQWVCFKKE